MPYECLVGCAGCNADPCCVDMAREDFEEGRHCNCSPLDDAATIWDEE